MMIVLFILALLSLLLVWSLLEPYYLSVERYTVTIPHLPEGWKGQRVALIADLQVGMWLANTATIKRAVKRIIKERPAVVLIAGDFIYQGNERAIAKAVTLLRPLIEAGLPCYSVLGNHDFKMPEKGSTKNVRLAQNLRNSLEAIGIRVLDNEVVRLESSHDEALYLVGVAAYIPDLDKAAASVAEVPQDTARIVLMHHPRSFLALPPHSAPLALAGHTHGGQFHLPGSPVLKLLAEQEEDKVLTSGWIDELGAEGNRLYINRGIGFSVVPLRLNCPPELTLITLT
jgi:uncharacterized protein